MPEVSSGGEKPKPRELRTDPETQRKRRLVELFEKGLDDVRGTIGYHATSLESIEHLIKTGHLPGAATEEVRGPQDPSQLQKSDLYFYPRKSQFPDYDPKVSKYFPDEARVVFRTTVYAQDVASEHYFLSKLKLGLKNQEYKLGAGALLSGTGKSEIREFREKLNSIGISDDEIDQAKAEAKQRKGVVLGLSKKLLKEYKPISGDPEEGDLRFNFPRGMDYTYISGIESIGEQERDFFRKLKESLPQ